METESDRYCTNIYIGNVQNSYENTLAIDHYFILGRIYTTLVKPMQTVIEDVFFLSIILSDKLLQNRIAW